MTPKPECVVDVKDAVQDLDDYNEEYREQKLASYQYQNYLQQLNHCLSFEEKKKLLRLAFQGADIIYSRNS